MRVIAGSAGGLSLAVPETVTRPTTDRVREALFSSLGERVLDADVLDLYAGSGALGIEALSRGAKSATFVDANDRVAAVIRKNLERTRLRGEVRNREVAAFLKSVPPGHYDLVFADPPYARDEDTRAELAALLASESLARCLRPDGLFLLETMDRGDLPQPGTPLWTSLRDRRYGGTRLHYLTPAAPADTASDA